MVDLRNAKPGDVYLDGYGYRVRILCIDRQHKDLKVVGLINIRGYEEPETYSLDGLFWGGTRYEPHTISKSDLVEPIEVINDEQKLSAQQYLISKGYPVNTGGEIPTYEELYEIIKDGIIDAI